MTGFLFLVLFVAAVLGWWLIRRAARLKEEAASREGQMLEALFAAKRAGRGNGGETIDVDRIFGREPAASRDPTSAVDVLRAAGVQAELIALVQSPITQPADEATLSGAESTASLCEERTRGSADPEDADAPVARAEPPVPRPAAQPSDLPVPVRDLVQTFYEARGYRAVPAGQSEPPIDVVLRHKTDPLRAYAFAPVRDDVSEATVRTMLDAAQRIDQKRLLIACEGNIAPELSTASLPRGVRVLDRRAIEKKLAQLDFPTSAKIRAVARRRAGRRSQSAG